MRDRHPGGPRPRHQRLHEHRPGSSAAFRWSVLLNTLLSALQLVIAFAFGSLALVGDALHNLGDVAGLLFGWGAERLSTRPTSEHFTYGYGRSTELAALANALLICAAGLVVMVEALQRLAHPSPVLAGPVAWAAAAGVVVNLLSAWAFAARAQHDLNRRAAMLHLLSDAAVSAAVLISALLVLLTGWDWLDSVAALGVGLAVAYTGWDLLRESVRLSLDAVPRHIDLEAVTRTLAALPGVVDVHHLHVWAISTSQTALTVHLRRHTTLPDMELLHRAKQQLAELGIVHSTIQLEPPDVA
ncbi:MAG: cation diffusion facilitator family transporter [Vulcanococcus sp.]